MRYTDCAEEERGVLFSGPQTTASLRTVPASSARVRSAQSGGFLCDVMTRNRSIYTFGKTRKQIPDLIRELIFQRSEHTCSYCGVDDQEEKLVIDHIVPVAKGGSDSTENLTASCFMCNSRKGDMTLDEWDLYCQEIYGLTLAQHLARLYLNRKKRNGKKK